MTSERTRSQITNFMDCLQKIRDIIEEVQRKPKEPSEEDKAVIRMRSVRKKSNRIFKPLIEYSNKIGYLAQPSCKSVIINLREVTLS